MRTLVFIFGIILGHSLSLLHINLNSFGTGHTFCSRDSNQNHNLNQSVEENYQINLKTNGTGSRILCWILTTPEKHFKTQHVASTWGKRCDKLLFMSSQTDKKFGTIGLPVKEGYLMLWQKAREAFKYIHKHYLQDYDWVLKADDDTFVIMENLRLFLKDKDPNTSHYYGCHLKGFVPNGYHTGGSGYVMSMSTLKRLVEEAFPNPKKCRQDDVGAEDTEISSCLGNLGIKPGDSRDPLGRHRFFPEDPKFFTVPVQHALNNNSYMWKKYQYKPSRGLENLSPYAISFHRISTEDMYTMEYLLYNVKIAGEKDIDDHSHGHSVSAPLVSKSAGNTPPLEKKIKIKTKRIGKLAPSSPRSKPGAGAVVYL